MFELKYLRDQIWSMEQNLEIWNIGYAVLRYDLGAEQPFDGRCDITRKMELTSELILRPQSFGNRRVSNLNLDFEEIRHFR